MQSNTTVSSSHHPQTAEPHRHMYRSNHALRMIISSALLAVLTSACAQSHEPPAQHSAGAVSSSTSNANKQAMDTTQQTAAPTFQVMTAEEISHRMLDLIGKIKTAEDVSLKNLETATGLKAYQDADNPNEYGVVAKITDTWFFNITVISGVKTGKRSRLLFSFIDQTHSDASMSDICQVDFAAYTKRLTELGFQSKPYYGEHNRLIYWYFTRDKISVQIAIRGENKEKVTHDCVSKIDIEI